MAVLGPFLREKCGGAFLFFCGDSLCVYFCRCAAHTGILCVGRWFKVIVDLVVVDLVAVDLGAVDLVVVDLVVVCSR